MKEQQADPDMARVLYWTERIGSQSHLGQMRGCSGGFRYYELNIPVFCCEWTLALPDGELLPHGGSSVSSGCALPHFMKALHWRMSRWNEHGKLVTCPLF